MIRGVRNGPSPAWLQRRLKAVGQRPISALVDMTNFITLSYGRPLHVYDLARLKGAIVARRAQDGEEVLALNGKIYTLDPSMTVIADDDEVHDIGGIMGGEHSGVTEATTDIVIECAYFDPEQDRADRTEARPHLRRAQPVRARRRSRLPRGRPAARHRAWRSRWPAAIPRRSSAPVTPPEPGATSSITIRRAARGLAGVAVTEDRQQRSCSGSASS